MLTLIVAYLILVQALDLVHCNNFHLWPIDTPVLQLFQEQVLLRIILAYRSVFAA